MGHRLPFLILGAAALAACTTGPPAPSRDPVRLPETPVSTLDGKQTDLGALLHGRPAVVSLWATWCEACLEEHGALNRLEAQASTRGDAMVLGVAVGEPRDKVLAFAAQHRLDYTQLVDEDFRLADSLGERRVPSTLVVDRAGRIVYRGAAFDGNALAAFRQAVGPSH